MSSDEKEHPYSDDELRRALAYAADKTGDAPCPFCKNNIWIFESARAENGAPYPKVAFIPMTNRAFFGPAPSIPTITLTCSNCGFIRHHSIPGLLKGNGNEK